MWYTGECFPFLVSTGLHNLYILKNSVFEIQMHLLCILCLSGFPLSSDVAHNVRLLIVPVYCKYWWAVKSPLRFLTLKTGAGPLIDLRSVSVLQYSSVKLRPPSSHQSILETGGRMNLGPVFIMMTIYHIDNVWIIHFTGCYMDKP